MRLLLTFLLCSTWMIGQSKISDNQIRTPPPLQCSDTSGSGTTQTCTTAPSFTPAAKDCVVYNTTTTNTGALTLNVNSQGAKPVKKWLGTALVAGDVVANKPQLACYDGTNWQLSTIGNAPSAISTPVSVANGGTGATTLTAHGVVVGNTTTAVNITSAGTSGQVLTSNGASSDPTFQAVSSAGPRVGAEFCQTGSNSCASVVNVPTSTLLLALFSNFTNSGGAGTMTCSDTLSLTWTQIGTSSFVNYSGTQSLATAAFWATSGASSGADTFTCSSTAGNGFGGLEVISVIGGSLTSPVDGTPASAGASAAVNISTTTTTANDLLFMVEEFSSGFMQFIPGAAGNATTYWAGAIWSAMEGGNNALTAVRAAGPAGTYYLQGTNRNYNTELLFAIH